MFCPSCGNQIADDASFCQFCGSAVKTAQEQAPNYPQQPFQSGGEAVLSKKELLKHPNLKAVKSNLITSVILLYFSGAVSFIYDIIVHKSVISGLLDAITAVGLGLWLHLSKSRASAIAITIFAGINTLYFLISTGKIAGYLLIIAGVAAISSTSQLNSAWNTYRTTGVIPEMSKKKR